MKKRNFLVVVLIVLLLVTVMVLTGCGPKCNNACGLSDSNAKANEDCMIYNGNDDSCKVFGGGACDC